jgi:hypothetical protein
MKRVLYEKVGRKYIPVAEYDSVIHDSFPKGTHIVMCYPGGQSRRYNINPAYAPMIAAGRIAEDAMSKAIVKASELRPQKTLLTEGQLKAWKKLAKELGDSLATLQINSAHDITQAGVEAMSDEAEKLLTNPTVKKAYDHFMLICELTKVHNE